MTHPKLRATQLLKLTQWLRQRPDDKELQHARSWLLAHPQSPGFTLYRWRKMVAAYEPTVCHVCGAPAAYVEAQGMVAQRREGYCSRHRDVRGQFKDFRLQARDQQLARMGQLLKDAEDGRKYRDRRDGPKGHGLIGRVSA